MHLDTAASMALEGLAHYAGGDCTAVCIASGSGSATRLKNCRKLLPWPIELSINVGGDSSCYAET